MNAISELRPRIGLAKTLKELQVIVDELRIAVVDHEIPDDLLHILPDIHQAIIQQLDKLEAQELNTVTTLARQIANDSHGLIGLKEAREAALTSVGS